MQRVIIIFLLLQSSLLVGQNLHTRNKDLPCLNKHYNIYAHAVYDSLRTTHSETALKNALKTANTMFAPICLSFSLCEMDTVFNYNYDALKGSELSEISRLYIGQNRINLYLIQDTLLSPGVSGLCAGNVGGLYNGNIYLLGLGSITHELGHFFGLGHTFMGDTLVDMPLNYELVDGSNCDAMADGICDTPADPFVVGEPLDKYIKNCIFIYDGKDLNGEYFQPDVGNIMSYYKCNCGFTFGQYMRMAQNYKNASKKHW